MHNIPPLRLALRRTVFLALTFPVLHPAARADVTTGLTAYWNFENDLLDQTVSFPFTATTVADDAVFANEPEASFGPGFLGTGYVGTGGGGYAAVPISPDVSGLATGSVSVALWFKAQAPVSEWQAAAAMGEGSAWRIARTGSNSPFTMSYAGGSADITSTSSFGLPTAPVAEWHHLVAVTEKGVSTRLFIDGVLQATGPVPTLTDNGNAEMWIGGNPDVTTRSWNGGLDEVAIWNRALTAADVTKIYTEAKNNGKSIRDILTVEGVDTDGDGMSDAWEIANLPAGAQLDNGSVNPAFGPSADPDNDGLSNVQEFRLQTNPQVADTDGDGLKDGVETNSGIHVSVSDTGTDPLKADTDGDGLKDGVENPDLPWSSANPATQPGTSPLLADTDGDGFPDGIEVNYGSDPTEVTSVPSAGTLPIVDTFEDGIFDPARWSTDVSVNGGGAAVTEQGGHITITGRGHFFTTEEFDPVTGGGLHITGKWTFNGTDDFLQILTRSDALPAGDYGETNSGIEFSATMVDNSMNITGRGGPTANVVSRAGAVSLKNGVTYDFTIIDDGAGYVSFLLSESGKPGNAAILTGSAGGDALENHVVFHNREGAGHVAYLQEVAIGALTDTDGDGLPDFWETAYGLDELVADAQLDSDADGITNGDEYLKGLNPKNADTDGDGFADGKETDTGVWNSADDTGTDPLIADTDGDGLRDGLETNTGVYGGAASPGTNPNLPDTDGDNLSDSEEIAVGRNPVDPRDGRTGLDVGLTAYWSFDNTLNDVIHGQSKGDSTVADNGVFTGEPDVSFTTESRFGGGALELNGGAGWITVPKSVDTIGNQNTRSVSISVWLKANAFDSTWQAAISHGEGSHWRIARQGDTSPGIIGYAGGSTDIYSTTGFEPVTEWFHVAAVSETGVGTRLYINGVQESTGPSPSLDVVLASSPDLFIGANPGAGGREWNGEIDDAAVWSRPLTEDEVAQIYTAGTGSDSLGTLIGLTPAAAPISITAYSFNQATKQVSLTWTSAAATDYTVRYSTNLTDWTGVAVETVAGAEGSTTRSFTVPAAVSTAGKVFFRVQTK